MSATKSRLAVLTPAVAQLFSSEGWDALAQLPDVQVDVERDAIATFDAQQVRSYVDRLPARERAVVQLRYGLSGDALTVRQVAAYCEMSVGAAHDLERRGLDQLRAMYAGDGLLA